MDRNRLKKIITETAAELERLPFVEAGVSNRHIHMSRADMDILFGAGYRLTPVKNLLPGQYASSDTVTVTGGKGRIEKVRVLGPERSETQIELSVTDGFTLGIPLPVNESGDLSGAGSVVIENPLNGARIERSCAIAALRHIHLTPEFAGRYGLSDKQYVSVEFQGRRGLVFNNVLLRVSRNFRDEMHVDTDEANAGKISTGDLGKIIV